MPPLTRVAIRLSAQHLALLDKIATKNGLTRTSAIRMAILRLAETEGLRTKPSKDKLS